MRSTHLHKKEVCIASQAHCPQARQLLAMTVQAKVQILLQMLAGACWTTKAVFTRLQPTTSTLQC
jgi:hypothetical protein